LRIDCRLLRAGPVFDAGDGIGTYSGFFAALPPAPSQPEVQVKNAVLWHVDKSARAVLLGEHRY
jgi:hypothetical protein